MNQRISLQELIAINNTPKAKALIIKYGYRPARSYNDLIKKLTQFTKEHREDALKELVEIHPHKDLILSFNQPIETEQKSSCDGNTTCSKCMAKQQQFSGFDGTANAPTTNQVTNQNQSTNSDWKSMIPMVAVTSLVTASLVILISRAR